MGSEYRYFLYHSRHKEESGDALINVWNSDDSSVKVTSFATNNLYVSNSDVTSEYQISLDQLSFIDGYTGKFCNIGTANMNISTKSSMPFVGSCTSKTSLTLLPQESVELVCYNNGNEKQLLVIGKVLE